MAQQFEASLIAICRKRYGAGGGIRESSFKTLPNTCETGPHQKLTCLGIATKCHRLQVCPNQAGKGIRVDYAHTNEVSYSIGEGWSRLARAFEIGRASCRERVFALV